MLISPLIKPGTVSSTYYNHYSALRTLEDLLLTGQTCTEPSNADTPLAAGTVCGGLDGQGHIGYAAQAGLADFGPDVFTAQSFTAVTTPPGYRRRSAPARGPCTAPSAPTSVTAGMTVSAVPAASAAQAAPVVRPAAGATAATAATVAPVRRRSGRLATEVTAATAPAHPRSSSTESG